MQLDIDVVVGDTLPIIHVTPGLNIKPETEKRIRIYFNHSGLICCGDEKEQTKNILDKVMSAFGTITHTFYHESFSFGFITFSSNEEAAAAIEGLQSTPRLREIIAEIKLSISGDRHAQSLLDSIFVTSRSGTLSGCCGELCFPSWAMLSDLGHK